VKQVVATACPVGSRYGRIIQPLLFANFLRSSRFLGEGTDEDGEVERRIGGSASLLMLYHQVSVSKPT